MSKGIKIKPLEMGKRWNIKEIVKPPTGLTPLRCEGNKSIPKKENRDGSNQWLPFHSIPVHLCQRAKEGPNKETKEDTIHSAAYTRVSRFQIQSDQISTSHTQRHTQ